MESRKTIRPGIMILSLLLFFQPNCANSNQVEPLTREQYRCVMDSLHMSFYSKPMLRMMNHGFGGINLSPEYGYLRAYFEVSEGGPFQKTEKPLRFFFSYIDNTSGRFGCRGQNAIMKELRKACRANDVSLASFLESSEFYGIRKEPFREEVGEFMTQMKGLNTQVENSKEVFDTLQMQRLSELAYDIGFLEHRLIVNMDVNGDIKLDGKSVSDSAFKDAVVDAARYDIHYPIQILPEPLTRVQEFFEFKKSVVSNVKDREEAPEHRSDTIPPGSSRSYEAENVKTGLLRIKISNDYYPNGDYELVTDVHKYELLKREMDSKKPEYLVLKEISPDSLTFNGVRADIKDLEAMVDTFRHSYLTIVYPYNDMSASEFLDLVRIIRNHSSKDLYFVDPTLLADGD